MKVPEVASALTPTSGATRRNSSGTSTVEPGGTLTLILLGGPRGEETERDDRGLVAGVGQHEAGVRGFPGDGGQDDP
jgi:hypothetical protein